MADENRCEPPPEWRGKDGLHIVAFDDVQEIEKWHAGGMWDSHGKPEHAAGEGMRYIGPYTPPATVAALVEALENLMDVQTFATGWDNGVTDATGTMNEGDHWHGLAMDRARAALALYRGEAGQ